MAISIVVSSFTYVVAYRGKIDPTTRAPVNPDSECLGEECCSSVGDETFWDVGEHLRHSVIDDVIDDLQINL